MSKLRKSSMDDLLGGLIGDAPENVEEQTAEVSKQDKPQESSLRGRPSCPVKKDAVTTLVPSDLLAKVRAIGEREELSLTDLFTTALKMLVKRYEEKNGVVRVRQQKKKKDIGEVFDI